MSAEPTDAAIAGVRIEGDHVVIRVPIRQAHGFRVALAECPCRGMKSAATQNIRRSLDAAMGKVLAKFGGGL